MRIDKYMVPEAEFVHPDDCWRLLGETTVGRLAVIVEGHPDVFPVNFTPAAEPSSRRLQRTPSLPWRRML